MGPINVFFFLDAFGGQFVGPGKQQDERKAEPKDEHEHFHDPGRCFDTLEHDVGHLQDQPAGDDVSNGNPEDVAALQFFK